MFFTHRRQGLCAEACGFTVGFKLVKLLRETFIVHQKMYGLIYERTQLDQQRSYNLEAESPINWGAQVQYNALEHIQLLIVLINFCVVPIFF